MSKSTERLEELYLKCTGIILQCYCTSSSVGGRLQAQSGVHPFMWKPRPCVSYHVDHPLPSDRDCQAAAGHSQAAAACGDATTYRRWPYTKHPQLVQSVSPCGGVEWVGGGRIFSLSVLTENPKAAQTDVFCVEQPTRPATCSLLVLYSDC